jgi:hypothetical protein
MAAAAVVGVIGAIEAYLNVRSDGGRNDGEIVAFDAGKARIIGPSITSAGRRFHLNLVRVTF